MDRSDLTRKPDEGRYGEAPLGINVQDVLAVLVRIGFAFVVLEDVVVIDEGLEQPTGSEREPLIVRLPDRRVSRVGQRSDG